MAVATMAVPVLPVAASEPSGPPAPAIIDNLDWISINTSCFAVSNAIAKTSSAIHAFVREVRESRAELDVVSSELHSLDGVLDLLKDDASGFPAQLAQKTPAVLKNCLAIIDELQGCIAILDRSGISKSDKKSRWMASRGHIGKLRWTLEGYKATLGLAVDLVSLTNAHAKSSRGQSPSPKDAGADLAADDTDDKSEMSRVAAQINSVTARLQDESQQNGAVARLQHYLGALHAHAITAMDLELDQLQDSRQAASTAGDAPDSAIDMTCEDQAVPAAKPARSSSTPRVGITMDEIDELLDELKEMPGRPPTPPPRSIARRSLSTHGSVDLRPSTSDSHYESASNSNTNSGTNSVTCPSPSSPRRGPRRSTSQSHGWSYSPNHEYRTPSENYYTPVTELSVSSDTQSVRSLKRPDSATMGQVGQVFSHIRYSIWENPRAHIPLPLPPPTPTSVRPSTASSLAPSSTGFMRRSSSRLSSTLKHFHLRLPSSKSINKVNTPVSPPPPPLPEPSAIFGVPLAQSMELAKGIAGTRHDGGGASTRDYPLSVLRCVYFIRDQGIKAPHIFGQDGDQLRLSKLKDIFSSPSTSYGKELDWSRFSVYEAADLVLLFLSELPKPLVSEPVAKRWVSLSRQATVPGSLAMRLDQGIDFWEEAFTGIRGPSRALFKLLLNLWGDIADAAESNDMTAERLAGRIMRPLLHLSAARYDTDLMLGLAFMIRKRSEYSLKMNGARKSNAAF
ncbi:hypothetical protein B0T17DRAFT_530427 [Bombardia bombarda]|uniref:Rho-GAP domain-containing protein n=1 Tax=Bombardia bombarda TaxID=252184 RepID=A0AA40C4Z6_9PEZI|nr:hypothetical protein B0T17DRAFT_530427 [Bombardia bombarda]